MKKNKAERFISFTLAVVMIFGLFVGVPVSATDVPTLDEWIANTYGATDTTSSDLTPRYGSNGKFIAPIEPPVAGSIAISTRAELEAIKDNLSGNYHLVNDIDLSGKEWVPIGDKINYFKGVFDGQGYVIKNLTITGTGYEYNGLFGYSSNRSSEIKNIGMENTQINITRSSLVRAGGICGLSIETRIDNCYNTGNVLASGSDNVNAGGICGHSVNIYNCYNTGNISAISSTSYASAGGICGNTPAMGKIKNCYNTGDVNASAFRTSSNAAGICGSSYSGNISFCCNSGTITSSINNPDNGYNVGSVLQLLKSPKNVREKPKINDD